MVDDKPIDAGAPEIDVTRQMIEAGYHRALFV
jgi:hypothetical protein